MDEQAAAGTVVVQAVIPRQLAERLKVAADADRRSVSFWIRQVLEQKLEQGDDAA